jgi:hypothetical protein
VDTSKHMVFMVWEPRWATYEGSEIIYASAYAFGAYFFRLLGTFVDFRVKMMPTLECSFLPGCLQIAPFLDKAPTSRHGGVRERSRVRTLLCNEAPGCPKEGP